MWFRIQPHEATRVAPVCRVEECPPKRGAENQGEHWAGEN